MYICKILLKFFQLAYIFMYVILMQFQLYLM